MDPGFGRRKTECARTNKEKKQKFWFHRSFLPEPSSSKPCAKGLGREKESMTSAVSSEFSDHRSGRNDGAIEYSRKIIGENTEFLPEPGLSRFGLRIAG
jgi:hypothetical protein